MSAEVVHLSSLPKDEKSIQSFTSKKLDWMKCCCFDRQLQAHDFAVAFVIAQHINARTGITMLSDETIAMESGGRSERSIRRSRVRLRDAGWLDWKRTRSANVYRLNHHKVNQMLDLLIAMRDARKEKRRRDCRDPLS